MNYRVATIVDYPAITELINSSEYYAPMAATDLDGPIIVAEHEGELKGCLWAMVCGRHAFLDYFVVQPSNGRVAFMLMLAMEKLLQENGVRFVRGTIRSDNRPARRIAASMGGVLMSGYDLGYKRLPDGNSKDGNE